MSVRSQDTPPAPPGPAAPLLPAEAGETAGPPPHWARGSCRLAFGGHSAGPTVLEEIPKGRTAQTLPEAQGEAY